MAWLRYTESPKGFECIGEANGRVAIGAERRDDRLALTAHCSTRLARAPDDLYTFSDSPESGLESGLSCRELWRQFPRDNFSDCGASPSYYSSIKRPVFFMYIVVRTTQYRAAFHHSMSVCIQDTIHNSISMRLC